MGIYKNDYTKQEDEVLWELHEIRHQLHEENKGKSKNQINEEAKRIIEKYKSKLKQHVG